MSRQFNELIDEYITSVNNCCSGEKTIPTNDISYRALVGMHGYFEPENGEKKRQDKLISKSSKMGYEHVLGRSKNTPGKITFCQFTTSGYSVDDSVTAVDKLYINCDRDQIANISQQLMKLAHKSKTKLSFKITYEDGINDNYKRSDNIVIYTEDANQKENIINILSAMHSKDSSLFNPDKSLPFMPKVKGAPYISNCGVQKAGRHVYFKGIGNVTPVIGNTWNSKMAAILQESLAFGVNMAKNGYYLPFDPSDPATKMAADEIKDCSSAYLNMSDEQKQQVQSLMKDQIMSLCEKNSVQLDDSLIPQKNIMADLANKANESTSTPFIPKPKSPSDNLVR